MGEITKEGALNLLSQFGQEHLLNFYDQLDAENKTSLLKDIMTCNLAEACKGFVESSTVTHLSDTDLLPIPKDAYVCRKDLKEKTLTHYWDTGLRGIVQGKIAVVVLAGGQATRLGMNAPKGVIGLGINATPSDNLLGLQAAKIKKLQELAREAYPDIAEQGRCKIIWLIMTSAPTRKLTELYMQRVIKESNLDPKQVIFFDQPTIPCFDYDGKVLLADKNELAKAPNGNGGLYSALKRYIPLFREHGTEYIHVYCVDNILCRVADPHFIGLAMSKNLDCIAKVVEKKKPQESVGVICQLTKSDTYGVIEYSELSKGMAEKREGEKLAFRAGNIANHLFHIDLLERACNEDDLPYHRANKKIPYVDLQSGEKITPSQPNGVKMEKFVFDVFGMSKRFCIWEVERSQEFSPLKNPPEAGKDCILTCRADLYAEHNRWLENAGITWIKNALVLPKFSYAGEGLEQYVDAGKPGYQGPKLAMVKKMKPFEVPSERFFDEIDPMA